MRSQRSNTTPRAGTRSAARPVSESSTPDAAGAADAAVLSSKPPRGNSAASPPITVTPLSVREGVVSLDGYGVRIAVERGHLVLADGIGSSRRAGRFSKATCGIKRLVVRGSAYFITGDALAWLTDIGASFTNLGYDGELLAAWSPPGAHEPALRRAQAIAPWTDHGVELVRYLLEQKVIGQLANIERFFPADSQARDVLRTQLEQLRRAMSAHDLLFAEATAANTYWRSWEGVPVTFARRDLSRVPEHWKTFGPRLSAVSGKAYQASNPANALVNYLYAILAAETRAACLTIGLDPDIGLFHVDQRNRSSLVYDLLEPTRPAVEAWVYHALSDRVWTCDDFGEVQHGVCRVFSPLTHALSETAGDWHKAVAPYVEHVAHVLRTMTGGLQLPSALANVFTSPLQADRVARRRDTERYTTPITQRNRQRVEKPAPGTPLPKLPPACRNCGVILTERRRTYCDGCLPEITAERKQRFLAAGAEARERMLARAASGDDVQHSEGMRRLRSEQAKRIHAAEAAWRTEHGLTTDADRDRYRRDLLPALAGVSTAQIMHMLGIAKTNAQRIKRGDLTPHARHWPTLAKLAGVEWPDAASAIEPSNTPRDVRNAE